MLKEIRQIKGIGLFHDVNRDNGERCELELQKTNIIYADNGRGKSTLVSLFSSCSTNNPELLLSRRTIKGKYDPEVDLIFSNKPHAKFKNGCWDEKHSEFLVFDADFVEQNVYAGGKVTTDQRKNLLEFALGESAIAARDEYGAADQETKAAVEAVTKTTSQLSDIHKEWTLTKFKDLPKVPDADEQIATLNKNIIEAQNIDSIKSKPLPLQLVEPTLNIEPFFDILGTSLVTIDEGAEQKVKDHLNTHNKHQLLEKWISDGHAYGEEENCLFCNQPLKDVQLIQAYRSYFNKDYNNLNSNVAQLAGSITKICSNTIIPNLKSRFEIASACINGWPKDIKITMPTFDENAARNALANIQSLLEKLKCSKEVKLLEAIGSEEDKKEVVKEWQTILDVVVACNNSISNAAKLITAYRDNLAKLEIKDLQQQICNLEMAKKRHQPDAIKLLAQIERELAHEKDAEKKKKIKKSNLDKIAKVTLGRYEGRINDLLGGFGAQFCISDIDFNYYSGIRSDYVLQMRDKDINLTARTPNFKTSLSEGDKRTLAFAFFIASVESNPDLADKIIIIDDPMCSLDLNRKHQTCMVLKNLHEKCKQMIVLAHDIHFLKYFLGVFDKKQLKNIKCLKLKNVKDNYSDFDTINIERECESTYFKHIRMLCKYVNKDIDPSIKSITIATSIRPMLEGYLRNRFPNLMGDKPSFGDMIKTITESKPSSSLFDVHKIAGELDAINRYTRQFHHDNQAQIVDSELLVVVNSALAVVYGKEIPKKT